MRGGLGRDVLTGGAGSDVFVFGATAESGATHSLADRITDFTAGDRINVMLIDANVAAADNSAFVIDRGGTFSAGEIRQIKIGADILLDFNVDQDVAAEMSVLMLNHGVFVANDFVL